MPYFVTLRAGNSVFLFGTGGGGGAGGGRGGERRRVC